ncbi:MAG: hypothetical protein IPI22_05900 [Bacteroidetes bacterium]|nr:hypothetical protein [Bacteroidota bacterium]
MKSLLSFLFTLTFILITHISYTQNKNNNSNKVDLEDQLPSFPGGEDSLISFIQKNLQYPTSAFTHAIEGKIVISYVVDELGKVGDAQVVHVNYNHELDFVEEKKAMENEALRIVTLMPPGSPVSKRVKM